MNIYPVFQNILIEPIELKTTVSAVLLPETLQDKTNYGKVVACPESTDDNPVIVKPGDMVIYDKVTGTEIKFEGKNYVIINQKGIMAIIK